METIINGRKLKVYWMYNSTGDLGFMMHVLGVPEAQAETLMRLPMKKQVEECLKIGFDASGLPPDTTWCFLAEEGKVIAEASVVRYYKDVDDRDSARKYSLGKLLKELEFSKEERRKFWESYLNRNGKKVPTLAVV